MDLRAYSTGHSKQCSSGVWTRSSGVRLFPSVSPTYMMDADPISDKYCSSFSTKRGQWSNAVAAAKNFISRITPYEAIEVFKTSAWATDEATLRKVWNAAQKGDKRAIQALDSAYQWHPQPADGFSGAIQKFYRDNGGRSPFTIKSPKIIKLEEGKNAVGAVKDATKGTLGKVPKEVVVVGAMGAVVAGIAGEEIYLDSQEDGKPAGPAPVPNPGLPV